MKQSAKGYVVALADNSVYYIPGAYHVERDDSYMMYADDTEAAKAAEQDGVALVYGMDGVLDGVYIDTPDNRAAILAGLEKYPEYKEIAILERVEHLEETVSMMKMELGKGQTL